MYTDLIIPTECCYLCVINLRNRHRRSTSVRGHTNCSRIQPTHDGNNDQNQNNLSNIVSVKATSIRQTQQHSISGETTNRSSFSLSFAGTFSTDRTFPTTNPSMDPSHRPGPGGPSDRLLRTQGVYLSDAACLCMVAQQRIKL